MKKTIEIQVPRHISESFTCDRCGIDATYVTSPRPKNDVALAGVYFDISGGFFSDYDLLYDVLHICNSCAKDFYDNWLKKEAYGFPQN